MAAFFSNGAATTTSGAVSIYAFDQPSTSGWIGASNLVTVVEPSPKEQRVLRLRLLSWDAIDERERLLLRERRPSPSEPPRPRRPRGRVTSPANAYRVTPG